MQSDGLPGSCNAAYMLHLHSAPMHLPAILDQLHELPNSGGLAKVVGEVPRVSCGRGS